jgi:NADH-quinone oxidoreductase subunit L
VGNAIDEFLHPVFADVAASGHAVESAAIEWGLMGVAALAAALGGFAAYWIYVRRWGLAQRMTRSAQWLYDIVYNKYYVDEAYTEVVVKPLRMLGRTLADTVEQRGIDGAVNGLAWLIGLAGEGLRRVQTGLVRNYALAMLVGVVGVVVYFVVRAALGW